MKNLVVTLATEADFETLTAVEIQSKRASIPECVEEVEVDPEKRHARWQTYFAGTSPSSSRPERVVFLASEAGAAIGYIAGHHTTRFDLDCEIQSFYVLKEWQRKGVGETLLRHLATWMAGKGFTSACVGVAPENPYRTFYQKHGAQIKNPHWFVWENLPAFLDHSREG